VAEEQLEQIELDPGQDEGALTPVRLAGGEVQRELAEAEQPTLTFEAST